MTFTTITLIIIILIVVGVLLFFIGREQQRYFPRAIMTDFEKKMFLQLKKAYPQHHVFAQVAFSALITNQNYKIRSQFNRKVTDFVIMNQQFVVLVIIELDDPSHLQKQEEDAFRDKMLIQAGYKVLRYTQIPTIQQLQYDISK